MLRNLLAIIAGLIVGIIVISLVEMIGHSIYPMPEGFDPTDKDAIDLLMRAAPFGALLLVILAYMAGAFASGFVASWISGSAPIRNALIVGIFLLVAGIINLIIIPHPVWFAVVSVLVYLPLAYFGGKTGLKMRKPQPENEK